jgi:hypothetical protein
MEIVGVGEDGIRYDLAEPVKRCLGPFLGIWDRFVIYIIRNWNFLRRSTAEEHSWLKHFFAEGAVDRWERIFYSKRLSFRKTASEKDIQLHTEVIGEMFDEIEKEFRRTLNEYSRVIAEYGSPVQEFLEFLYPRRLRPRILLDWYEKLSPDPANIKPREEISNAIEAASDPHQLGSTEAILERAKSHILRMRAKQPAFGY